MGGLSMFEQDLYDILFQDHSRIDKELTNEISSKDLNVNCGNDTDQSENFVLSNTDENILIMEQTANNPSWRDIPRFNKPFGRIAKLIKRIIRKLTTNISREETKAAITQLQEKQTILANKANDTDLSIIAIKEVQASQNYQIVKLQELKSELEIAFSRISNMEDCANELKEISAFSNKLATLSYAQSGEDQIIQYILKCLRIPISSINYLDLGANHAKEISNTYSFYKQGARGVLLEANPRLIPELKLYRSEDEIIPKCLVSDVKIKSIPFYILNGDGLSSFDKKSVEDAIAQNSDLKIETVEEVETITMDEIISNYFPVAPTMLNIDIEGAEEEIISSIDFETWRPLIIIIETIPYHPYLVHDEKRVSLVKQLIEKNYTEYAFTGINSIMLDKKQLK